MTVSQTRFHTALLDPKQPVPEGLSDGQGHPAGRRFAVYRNNVASSLTEALELSFPAILKLIGEENFKKVASVFLRQHPPSVPMLSQYGAEMPDFLTGFEPLQHIGYLPDVARLEQAIRLSYHAADAAPADASVLQTLAPEALLNTRFGLAPAVRMVRSPWPIHAIWAFNLEDGPKPEPGAQNVLITRPKFDPQLTPIPTATAAFIDALASDAPLGTAHDAATQHDPEFDLSHALGLLLSNNAVTRIIVESSE
ncbi:putative DNA-binding domain-containing protein [Roseovarius sp. 2305UL8-3]|uniref:HvfC/BufC family peptide modification chaperone n=1 Tax=Roseovarius conchicola TaxID=3121636 RepID=UPI003528039B